MADVVVQKGATSVTLTLSEEEALHVLGVLGHGTGITPNTYNALFDALLAAGYDRDLLYGASDKYPVINGAKYPVISEAIR